MRKIQYENKTFINPDIGTPNNKKVTDSDMNEIKAVVNDNADTLQTQSTNLINFVNETNTRITTVETNITTINDNIDTIVGNIEQIETTTYTKTETDALLDDKATVTSLESETTARENADTHLQEQIDGIVASSDVVDIVGTYQELLNYDTTHLGDNDIIKVLDDSTHNNATSYFRWKKSTATWQYIGSEGPYYTKSETDTLLNGKVNVVAGKGLSTNDFTNDLKNKLNGIETDAQVNKIETIKVNGSSQTITNKSVDISVPTKTSDLQNNSGFITNSADNLTNYYKKAEIDTTLNSYATKTYVDNLIGDINNAIDLINGEVV